MVRRPLNVWTPKDPDIACWFPKVGADFSAHRERLKMDYLLHRDLRCRGCDEWLRGEFHMHESPYSRRDVMGWPRPWRVLIMCPYSVIALCRDCNLGLAGKSPPGRLEVLEEHVAMYGLAVVRWARSLPFTVNPLRGALGGPM